MTCAPALFDIMAEAPAIQLAEHAQAILADDARLGFERNDPVLTRLATGSSHAAPGLPS